MRMRYYLQADTRSNFYIDVLGRETSPQRTLYTYLNPFLGDEGQLFISTGANGKLLQQYKAQAHISAHYGNNTGDIIIFESPMLKFRFTHSFTLLFLS